MYACATRARCILINDGPTQVLEKKKKRLNQIFNMSLCETQPKIKIDHTFALAWCTCSSYTIFLVKRFFLTSVYFFKKDHTRQVQGVPHLQTAANPDITRKREGTQINANKINKQTHKTHLGQLCRTLIFKLRIFHTLWNIRTHTSHFGMCEKYVRPILRF